MSKKILATFKKGYLGLGQKVGAAFYAPSQSQAQVALFLIGIGLLSAGLVHGASAQIDVGNYNDQRIALAVNRIFTYLEGSFGALVMVAAGIGAIFASAFGQYKAALGLLVVAVGAFILRSLVSTFFNDQNIGDSI